MLEWFLLVSTLCLLFGVYLWTRMKERHRYWTKRGVVQKEPLPIVGNLWPLISQKTSQVQFYIDIYKEYAGHRWVGIYHFWSPMLLIRDASLAERILIKDFSYFPDRGMEFDEGTAPLDESLLLLKGNRWRALRSKLSPVFTAGRIKGMFNQAHASAKLLIDNIEKGGGEDMELKNLMTVYTLSVIASTVFGLDSAALRPDSEFVSQAQSVFLLRPLHKLKLLMAFSMPWARRYLRVPFTRPEAAAYFAELVRNAMRHQATSQSPPKNFVHLLMQLREKGTISYQRKEGDNESVAGFPTEEVELTDELLTAQAYFFLTAGFDTTSTALQFAVLELSRHPQLQEVARAEVIRVVNEEGGHLSYQAIAKMEYLDKCVKETLRMYPATPGTRRVCVKRYQLEEGLIIEPGTVVNFPHKAIQNDPEYYPEPEVFRPERFDVEPKKGTYLPFGDGPRICIGLRFAVMNMKTILAVLLQNFKMEFSDKTQFPIDFVPNAFGNLPTKPLWCRFKKLEVLK